MEDINRGTGRTTRLIQVHVDALFNNFGEAIEVKDHWDDTRAHRYLTSRIIDRYHNEFNLKRYELVTVTPTSLKLQLR